MAKKGKSKISKVKRNNQTTNKMKKQGKLKLQRHKTKVQKQKQPVQETPEYSSDSESSSNEWADMLDEDEKQYIVKRLAKQPNLLANIPEKEENKRGSKRKKDKERMPKVKKSKSETNLDNSDSGSASDTDSEVEEKYEKELSERPAKKMRALLPIKTKDGFMERAEECEDSETEQNEDIQMDTEEDADKLNNQAESDSDSGTESLDPTEGTEDNEEVTTVELIAARRDRLRHEKLRIGALCSSLLESPERKLKNLYPILYLMDEHLKDGTPNLLSVRKLASLSAAEVFRDILPDYKLRHQDYSDVKLKKDTLSLYKYEKELLEFYKRYLQRLEKAANVLRQKKGDRRKIEEPLISLALISIKCMASLLVARPNFNYATNIAQSLIPFLDCNEQSRDIVNESCVTVFREDNKGEITLAIVRLINQLCRRRGARLSPGALRCLLSLRPGDTSRGEELRKTRKQHEKNKKRIINLSKKEKKRSKKLKEVERELLETEAKESETARNKLLTEVTKTVFHIYFRILKTSPSPGLLTAALEGIAKFTHVINLEYYSDLVSILSRLARTGGAEAGCSPAAGRRTRLAVVRAVLAVLASAGDALNVDPGTFHRQLYEDMLDVHAGGSSPDAPAVLQCVHAVSERARRVSCGVLRALAKRLATLAAQSAQHVALAALAVVWSLAQQDKHVSSLFDTEESVGSGRFDPLSPSPEHCNSHAAVGYEACALRGHFHPSVRHAAGALLAKGHWPTELHKLTPMQIFQQYDGSQLAFKPAIPPPKPVEHIKVKATNAWARPDFKEYCETVENNVAMDLPESIVRGLFTHVINLEYYSDLVSILSRLARTGGAEAGCSPAAGRRTRLAVVRAVLAVLASAGDALNVDPGTFHRQLYEDMLDVHAGGSSPDAPAVLQCVHAVSERARRVSCGVLRALAKRLATLAAQSAQHVALAALAVVWSLAQQDKHVSSLFDTEESVGSGRFDPLSPSPEHCNAHAAVGYEACALRGHFHPSVRHAAGALLAKGHWPTELHKLTPMQIFQQYDGSQLAFKPAIPPPKPVEHIKVKATNAWARPDFKEYCETVENNVAMDLPESIVR